MFHAQIAQRAFNTALLVEPSKSVAFLSGFGSRITDSLTNRPNACDCAI